MDIQTDTKALKEICHKSVRKYFMRFKLREL